MINRKTDTFSLVIMFLGGLVLLFIVAPIIGMVFSTSINDLIEVSKDAEVQDSIWLTIWVSIAGTLLLGIFSIPLSYVLAKKNFPLKNLVNGIIDLPIIIPHSAAGIAVLGIISQGSLLGEFGDLLGIKFVGTPAGIMMAMAFVSVPFLIHSARDGFSNVPDNLENAALLLGAGPTRVFFTISLPLAWRSILSGFIMMWGRGMSEFGAVVIVAYNPMITPVMIYERFTAYGLKYSLPVTILFVLICLTVFLLFRIIDKKNKNV